MMQSVHIIACATLKNKINKLFHIKVFTPTDASKYPTNSTFFTYVHLFPSPFSRSLLRHIQLSKDLCTPVDRSIFARKLPQMKQFSEADLPTFIRWCGLKVDSSMPHEKHLQNIASSFQNNYPEKKTQNTLIAGKVLIAFPTRRCASADSSADSFFCLNFLSFVF